MQKKPKKKQPIDLISVVGKLTEEIRMLGYSPTLVGGMALRILGSRRLTDDFDFLVEKEVRENKTLINVIYRHGFELVSKLDDLGHVLRTVDNENVAWAKLQMDPPLSAYFYNHEIGLRIDFLFDFPLPAKEVSRRAHQQRTKSYLFSIADKSDLKKMKEMALKDRNESRDLHDLEFLKKLKNS